MLKPILIAVGALGALGVAWFVKLLAGDLNAALTHLMDDEPGRR